MKVKNIFSGFTKAQKFYKRAIDSAKKRISPESNQIITDFENALEILTQKAETLLSQLKAQSPKATKKLQKVKTRRQEGGGILKGNQHGFRSASIGELSVHGHYPSLPRVVDTPSGHPRKRYAFLKENCNYGQRNKR